MNSGRQLSLNCMTTTASGVSDNGSKALKDILDPLKVKKNSYEITCSQCNSVIAILLPESNELLTWNELQQMEGRPVWVEQHHGDTKGWLLILRKCDDVVTCTTKHGNPFYLYKANYGEKWQAYRKERE